MKKPSQMRLTLAVVAIETKLCEVSIPIDFDRGGFYNLQLTSHQASKIKRSVPVGVGCHLETADGEKWWFPKNSNFRTWYEAD